MNALLNWPRNRLLLALPSRNLKRLMPELEHVRCHREQILTDADSSLDHVYFPDSGAISVVAVYADGHVIEMATIGREGCTGMQAFFGAKTSSVQHRKYRVGFTVAHQYLHQLEPDVRHAVLGNAGSIISFRVGAEDSPYLVREFHERFEEIDLLQLPNYRIYLKLMIDGTPSMPFSAVTLEPPSLPRLV
jgi:hypothetical protein